MIVENHWKIKNMEMEKSVGSLYDVVEFHRFKDVRKLVIFRSERTKLYFLKNGKLFNTSYLRCCYFLLDFHLLKEQAICWFDSGCGVKRTAYVETKTAFGSTFYCDNIRITRRHPPPPYHGF